MPRNNKDFMTAALTKVEKDTKDMSDKEVADYWGYEEESHD